MRAAVRFAFLATLAAAGAAAQAPQPIPSATVPTVRITVALVLVDAVVTDGSGRHVADLERDDFEVLQDGEPQKIKTFQYVPGLPRNTVQPGAEKLAPVGPPQPITAGQVKRTVALVIDDMALSFSNLVRVRESLRHYVEHQMQPGDLVAIVRTGGGVAMLEQFTTDRRILLESVETLKWRFAGRTGIGRIDPIDPRGATAREPEVLNYSYTLAALGAIGTIEQVVTGMRRMPGRKSIVFFSDPLRMTPIVSDAIDHVTDLCNRSAVSLYTVDPSGLEVNMPGAEVGPLRAQRNVRRLNQRNEQAASGADGEDGGLFPPSADMGEIAPQDGLGYLARRTGGIFFSNRNDIEGCIRDAADDQSGYYLLGYSPKEGTFSNGDSEKPKFHRLIVRLHRRGLRIRWKTGFNGVADDLLETSAPPATREAQLMEALASPFSATGLRVKLTSYFTLNGRREPVVRSMLYFGAKDLTFNHDSDGIWRAAVDIVTLGYRGLKQNMLQRQRRFTIAMTEPQHEQAIREGFMLNLEDGIKEPGPFLIRAVVRDAASEAIGSASDFVQVPDTRKNRFAVSGVFLQMATPEMLQTAGIAKRDQYERAIDGWYEGGPAVRRYRAGQDIMYGFLAFNAKLKNLTPSVTAVPRIFRNGELLHTGKSVAVTVKAEDDPKNLVGGGALRLGTRAEPGEYLLQVVVTDANAGKRGQTAQWIDFELVGPAATGQASAQ